MNFSALKPEGVAYDTAFDNLWILDNYTDKLYTVKKYGKLIREDSVAHITTEPLDLCYERPGVLWLLDPQFVYHIAVSEAKATSHFWQLYY